MPVLEALEGNVETVISVDTMFSDIAEEALKRGAEIVNDVSSFIADPKMIVVVARLRMPCYCSRLLKNIQENCRRIMDGFRCCRLCLGWRRQELLHHGCDGCAGRP